MKGLTIQCDVHFTRGQRTRKVIQEGPPPEPDATPEGTIPRIARLMALAIRFDKLIKAGEITGARLASIHNLRFLLRLMEDVRQAIQEDRLLDFRNEFFSHYDMTKNF